MVSMDRRIAGLALVSITLSGLLVFSFAEERSENPIDVLTNEYPDLLPSGEVTMALSIAARRPIKRVDIRSITLTTRDLNTGWLIDPKMEYNESSTPYDVLGNDLRLQWYGEELSRMGLEPRTLNATITLEDSDFSLTCIDYTDIISHLLGTGATANISLAYAVAMNETGYFLWLEGGNDFFVRPNRNIQRLMFSHNENETTYVPEDEIFEGSGLLPLSEAPRGVVSYQSVERDDTISVITTFDTRSVPSATSSPIASVQVIDVLVDGEAQRPVINVIRKEA